MTHLELAQEILKIVGPAANITEAHNCMTRLRFHVHRETFTAEALKKIPGVMGTNKNDDEWQVILGPGKAAKVTVELQKLLRQDPAASPKTVTEPESFSSLQQKARIGDGSALHAAIKKRNATPGKLLLKKIANIFVPLIPAFIGCGLITGILGICFKFQPALAQVPALQVLAVAGNAVFWGLNLFIGVNAAKEFGGTPILGGVLAAIITHPGLSGISLFGNALVPGRGGVIAVLLIALFGAYLERFLHKIIPDVLDLFLTPLLTILISSFIAIGVCQPIGGWLSEVIGTTATIAVNKGGAFTGFILGGCWLPMVMLGIHQGMTPIHAELLHRYGVTILLPILAMAGGGQVGAAFAVYCKTKSAALKKTVASALPVGIMGIGEPLIYGVTFPLGKPFIGACIGGACGGAVQAAFMVGASTMGISGLPLTPVTNNMPVYLVGLFVAYAGGFIATWLLGFDDPDDNPEEE